MRQEQQWKKELSQEAVLHISMQQKKLQNWQKNLEGDEKTGANIILKALEAPLYHIASKCRTGRLL